jgi:hypothetical protein
MLHCNCYSKSTLKVLVWISIKIIIVSDAFHNVLYTVKPNWLVFSYPKKEAEELFRTLNWFSLKFYLLLYPLANQRDPDTRFPTSVFVFIKQQAPDTQAKAFLNMASNSRIKSTMKSLILFTAVSTILLWQKRSLVKPHIFVWKL